MDLTQRHAPQAAPVLGCVWDLDGVLVDSGVAHKAAWTALAHELGYTWSDELHERTFGMRNPDIIRLAWGVSEPADLVSRWGDHKEELFRAEARSLQALPGVDRLVRDLHAQGWRQAIGSSAPLANITLLLEVLGLGRFFRGDRFAATTSGTASPTRRSFARAGSPGRRAPLWGGRRGCCGGRAGRRGGGRLYHRRHEHAPPRGPGSGGRPPGGR